jgi:hypothetical protein
MASPRAKFSLWRRSGFGGGRSKQRPPFITGWRAGFRPVTGREPFTPQYLSSGSPFQRQPGNASAPTELLERCTIRKWTGSPNGRLYGSVYALSSRQQGIRKVRFYSRPKSQKPDASNRAFGRRKRRPLSTRSPLRLLLDDGAAGDYSPSPPPPVPSPSPAATTAFWVGAGSGTEMMSGRSSKLCSIAA